MEQVKAPRWNSRKKKTVDLIPEERLKELLNILLPYGYSHYDGNSTLVYRHLWIRKTSSPS